MDVMGRCSISRCIQGVGRCLLLSGLVGATCQTKYMSHRGTPPRAMWASAHTEGQTVLLYHQQPMNHRQGGSGTRHGRGAGCGASGDGGRSMQNAVLRYPVRSMGKSLVSVLAPLWSLCSSARPGGAAGPRPCMRHPPAPPPPRVLKHSSVGAVAPTAPNFLSHA